MERRIGRTKRTRILSVYPEGLHGGPSDGKTISNECDSNGNRGTLKKCVNSQAVYPLSEQDGLEAQERRYTAHEEGKH